MTAEQKAALLRKALQTLLDAVEEAGDLGAPGGVMYAALMDKISVHQFEAMMEALVKIGCVRRRGERYIWIKSLPG